MDRSRVEQILNRAREMRVAVIGDCMLDVYLTGDVGRISPEAPVPVVRVHEERVAPGGAANVAAGVVALGAGCDLIGVVGEDSAAAQLTDALAGVGVRSEGLIADADRTTSTKTRVMARHQHVVRFDRESVDELSDPVLDRVIGAVDDLLDEVDAVILEDYNKGVLAPRVIQRTIEHARRRDIPSVADPKFRHFFEYRGIHVFKPNAAELAAALGVPRAPRDPDGLGRARDRLGCDYLLVTMAEEGMLLYGADGGLDHIRAVARDVYDVSGAGDTVTAVTATCLAAGATELEAARIANYAAGLEVSKSGVVPIRADEILAAFDDHMNNG